MKRFFLPVLVGCSSIAFAEDVPYEPTPHETVRTMLEAAKVGPNDFVIDLGSGDGRIVIAAARDFGARAMGVELNRELLAESAKNAARASVEHRVEFRRQDLFETDLSRASVLTLYLWPEVNLRLRDRITGQMQPGSRVVSHEHDMGDWEPDAVFVTGDDTVYLWVVPARVAGAWSLELPGEKGGRSAEIRLVQAHQEIAGRVIVGGRSTLLREARLRGDRISFEITDPTSTRTMRFQGKVKGSTIQGTLGGQPATMVPRTPTGS